MAFEFCQQELVVMLKRVEILKKLILILSYSSVHRNFPSPCLRRGIFLFPLSFHLLGKPAVLSFLDRWLKFDLRTCRRIDHSRCHRLRQSRFLLHLALSFSCFSQDSDEAKSSYLFPRKALFTHSDTWKENSRRENNNSNFPLFSRIFRELCEKLKFYFSNFKIAQWKRAGPP